MTRIYYTVGPASVEIPKNMLMAGANGVRLTFSFGTPDIQLARAQSVKDAAQETEEDAFVIADLAGGGARIGEIQDANGAESFEVTAQEVVGIVHADSVDVSGQKALPIPDAAIYEDMSAGDMFVIGDGGAFFEVVEQDGLRARSVFDAVVEGRRGLFVQNQSFKPACMTEKDRTDLAHIRDYDVYDAVALSFVSTAADVSQAKGILGAHTNKQIIAKIETGEGVQNIDSICEVADQIMIARGDLALAMPWERMPGAVDAIVAACKRTGTPFIMATQVAEGMLHGTMLTRAEMTDLWRWREEGADGVLLSRETAWGDRPIDTVRNIRRLLDVGAGV